MSLCPFSDASIIGVYPKTFGPSSAPRDSLSRKRSMHKVPIDYQRILTDEIQQLFRAKIAGKADEELRSIL